MIHKIIILLSLCCLVLCAIVGYLSKHAMQESQKRLGPAIPLSCVEVLEERPTETSRILVNEFVPGKHFAFLDTDNDGNWERLCVPFFPPKHQGITHSYRSVLICFKDTPNREAFKELIASGEIDTNYWPMRQNLNMAIHSQLAQQYKNMDFANSPVLHCGFEASNPVLGDTSLKLSTGVGSLAIFAAFIALLAGLFFKKKPDILEDLTKPEQNTNRAGLPVGSVLDRVTSMREQHPV